MRYVKAVYLVCRNQKKLVPALRKKRGLLIDFVFHAIAFPLDKDGFSVM